MKEHATLVNLNHRFIRYMNLFKVNLVHLISHFLCFWQDFSHVKQSSTPASYRKNWNRVHQKTKICWWLLYNEPLNSNGTLTMVFLTLYYQNLARLRTLFASSWTGAMVQFGQPPRPLVVHCPWGCCSAAIMETRHGWLLSTTYIKTGKLEKHTILECRSANSKKPWKYSWLFCRMFNRNHRSWAFLFF